MSVVDQPGALAGGGRRLARRLGTEAPNAIARRRAELAAAGIELTDLTDTNPTRHGLFDPAILEVVARHTLRAGRYDPGPRGPWPARAALAERYGGDPEDYWLCASTSEAYGWLFSLLAEPGEAVAVPRPGYPLVEPLARLHSVATRGYPTFYVHPSGWELDRDSLADVVADKAVRAVVVVNPNNPTGAYADAGVVDVAAARGLPLIADEVFFPYRLGVGDEAGGVAGGRIAGHESTLTFGLDGLSKLLAAPQLKVGWIRLSGPRLARAQAGRALDEIADTYLSVNAPVALALPELLGLADGCVARVTARLAANLAIAQAVLNPWRVRTVYGGWMMLLDVPPLMEADALSVALMERAGLYVHPGYFYDLDGTTLAISLLAEEGVFRESCTRLAAALTVLAADRD
ncbi:MAG: pyridoxal phosphate-dependent aminotransferase [Propionibacteriaceae bacterium]|nr:pyridoxal phosphate-dependent aminotransferase [Propionibacteriaceae bacterium]